MSRIHPNPIVQQIKILLFAIILSAILIYLKDFASVFNDPIFYAIWVVSVIYIIFLSISARFISLDIGDNDLLYRKGILSIRSSLVPYRKITDSRYSQSIAERVFSVGTLEIDTAGSDMSAIYIPSVPFKDLERIIQTIRSKRGDDPDEE